MVAHKDKLESAPTPQHDFVGWSRSLLARLAPPQRPLLEAAVALFEHRRVDLNVENVADDANAFVAVELLAEIGFDAETLAAALLLHDFTSAALTAEQIRTQLNPSVAELLEGVQRMQVIHQLQRQGGLAADQNQAEALRRMVFAMASDVRVVIVTLGWCVAHLRAAKTKSLPEQQAIAREALDLYAPLANRLGIWQIKWEIEDLALRYQEPARYKEIARLLEERRVEREHYLQRFIDALRSALRAAGIEVDIKGRPKHIYSIWKKMQRKNLDFNEIFDIRAVRVIAQSVAECYSVLGIVHSRWNYVRSEFDDYIAAPKDNLYRSLHTAVVGPESKVVEVQIRTPEMDEHAELGVAAHWRYKEGAGVDITLERKLVWLRQLLDWRDTLVAPPAVAEDTTNDALGERIYVFTPKGRIIDLPVGATPLDFAYHIHSDVGHRCRGAKVAGKIVQITSPLHNGDVVEVVTAKQGGPSRDWMNPGLGYLKSSKARDKVAQWFKHLNFDTDVAHGRVLLEKELHRVGMAEVNFERLAQRFDYGNPEKLFAAVGRGEMKAATIAHALQKNAPVPEVTPRIVAPITSPTSKSNVYIEGEGNVLTSFAKCCKPVPGDDIMGYITRGRGVTVHRQDCVNLSHFRQVAAERIVHVSWGAVSTSAYPVDIRIVASDRQGLLRDITATLANDKINVTGTNSISDASTGNAFITLTLQIKDVAQLSRLLSQIKTLPSVISVQRA